MEHELDPDVHWITAREAAAILHVTPARVRQLSQRDLLPHVRRAGHVYFRRPQLEVVAHARELRWHSVDTGPLGRAASTSRGAAAVDGAEAVTARVPPQ